MVLRLAVIGQAFAYTINRFTYGRLSFESIKIAAKAH